ncbi:MAG: hypothetical protein AB3N64_09155 [Puniceicoccaceae bacterium]
MKRNVASLRQGLLALATTCLLLTFPGCETTSEPEPEPVVPMFVGQFLSYEESGFMDARTGWIYPQSLPGGLYATQAWEFDRMVVGIEYSHTDGVPEISNVPLPVPESAVEGGTVTIMAYPAGFQYGDLSGTPDLGPVPYFMGLGHGHLNSMDEFWAYHGVLEKAGYNLWKLVKLADADAPGRIFHSFLVLQKLSEEKSEGFVVTVGLVDDVYVLIVNRRYVRTKEDVDTFGDWAYDVLKDMGLVAISS